MPHLFTVRWPLFARLEAVLLFPVALMMAGQIAPLRTFTDKAIVPFLSPLAVQLSVSKPMIATASIMTITLVPYLILLLVIDRFLTVRKGYALLSIAAIAIWIVAARHLPASLMDFVPRSIPGATWFLSRQQRVSVVTDLLAVLWHLWPLWIGLRDTGEVAMRLTSEREESEYARRRVGQAREQDVYYRQTAGFRGWRAEEQPEGFGGVPRENSVVKILFATAWIGAVVGVGTAWHNWNNLSAAAGRGMAADRPPPEVVPAPPPSVGRGAVTAPTPMPMSPVTQESLARPVTVTAALPAVRRPGGDALPGVYTPTVTATANEAIAERGGDGSFAFDAIVNGAHIPMLFDTGASVVAIRGEDAARIGIDVARLNYSAKVKTANGVADVAPVLIESLTIGDITQRNVPGFVAKRGMLQVNLLGQTFLGRLAGFNVESNKLVLRGR